ncbi:MAG: DciA family protein [Parvibaculum sp.]|nr:DciA family protein [Parvibaculum sp.]
MSKPSDHQLAPNRFSLPPIGTRVAGLTRDLFRKRGFAEGHILANWPDIAGDVIADYSAPERLVYPRRLRDAAGPSAAAVLEIRVDGPIALEIKHLEPQIIERINAYYGYLAVSRLKMTQGPLPPRAKARRRPIRKLGAQEREALSNELQPIAEPALKDALARLGERILGRTSGTKR